jgi:hypothetical protein
MEWYWWVVIVAFIVGCIWAIIDYCIQWVRLNEQIEEWNRQDWLEEQRRNMGYEVKKDVGLSKEADEHLGRVLKEQLNGRSN